MSKMAENAAIARKPDAEAAKEKKEDVERFELLEQISTFLWSASKQSKIEALSFVAMICADAISYQNNVVLVKTSALNNSHLKSLLNLLK
jgi:hypothetical protein